MRVLFLSDGVFPFVLGGMQKHSLMLVSHLLQAGHYVKLYHYTQFNNHIISNQQVIEEIEKVLNNKISPSQFESVCLIFQKKGIIPGHYLRNSKAYSLEIARMEKDIKDYDLIYVQGFSGWGLLEQKRNDGPLTMVNFHGLNMFQTSFGLRAGIEKLMLKSPVLKNMRFADFVVSLGGKLTTILQENGVSLNRIFVQRNAISESWISNKIHRSDAKTRFVYIGRNDKIKGLDNFFSAIKSFQSIDSVEFHIIGPVNNKESMNNVFFHGVVMEEQKLKNLIDKMDVVVCTSFSEGMPTYILECMARGLAVLSTLVGAMDELVDGSNGSFIRSSSVADIKIAIHDFIRLDRSVLDKMKEVSISKAKSHTWQRITKELEDFIVGRKGVK